MLVYGPVPSRRLGRSLGINNIPPKFCSYACVYCQVGRTEKLQIERRPFYEPREIAEEAGSRVEALRGRGEKIDYLSFVPDGEPSLDENLGTIIDLLKPLGIKIAVISNASLIWRHEVREDLAKADWVSLKTDSTIEKTWRKTNRPNRKLVLDSILEGMLEFKKEFRGELATETMLAKGFNDFDENFRSVAAFLATLQPDVAYLSIPTRPPADKRVLPPDEEKLNSAYQCFKSKLPRVEYLIGYEGNAFASTGDPEKDLLSITSVHPMRLEAVNELLEKSQAAWSVVQRLIDEGSLIEADYEGQKYYMRKLAGRS